MPATDPRRRRFLKGLAAAPLLAGAAVAATRLGSYAAVMRPGGRGSSTGRCASCGADDHMMLDLSCPASPEVSPT